MIDDIFDRMYALRADLVIKSWPVNRRCVSAFENHLAKKKTHDANPRWSWFRRKRASKTAQRFRKSQP